MLESLLPRYAWPLPQHWRNNRTGKRQFLTPCGLRKLGESWDGQNPQRRCFGRWLRCIILFFLREEPTPQTFRRLPVFLQFYRAEVPAVWEVEIRTIQIDQCPLIKRNTPQQHLQKSYQCGWWVPSSYFTAKKWRINATFPEWMIDDFMAGALFQQNHY
jgi:hypothetical protein